MTVNRETLPEDLLDAVKNHLNITWSDEATDQKISGIIASGMMYLNRKAGAEMNYEADGTARTLLLEYSRYMRDEALDVFENNYTSMILDMRHERMVNAYASETEQTGT